jgi:HPt (histidine-containing phosphotransfer) domain-containing protein
MIPDIDLERLRQIGAPGDPAVVAILQRFIDTLNGRVEGISAAASVSPAEVSRQLHQLAGSAANCGFAALADFCRRGAFDPGSTELASLASRAAKAWNQLMENQPHRH